jgi:hypothetical protein
MKNRIFLLINDNTFVIRSLRTDKHGGPTRKELEKARMEGLTFDLIVPIEEVQGKTVDTYAFSFMGTLRTKEK